MAGRRFQFTLASLLILVLIAAIGSGWLVTWRELQRAHEEIAKVRAEAVMQRKVAESERQRANVAALRAAQMVAQQSYIGAERLESVKAQLLSDALLAWQRLAEAERLASEEAPIILDAEGPVTAPALEE